MLFQFYGYLASLALVTLLPSALGLYVRDEVPAHLKGKRSYVERDGVQRTIFEHDATGAKLDFVTNSGICETTPGVNQYSGYFSVGTNMSMWFWFFEARNEPQKAPLALWLNGGPGCSSMIGLFQENGPCTFNNHNFSTPILNPYSFNEYANMLYVDEPIGTGFSFGTDPVNSTYNAAPYVWTLLQAFFANFQEYDCRDFGYFTESYGGHYGPWFADYFEQQNLAISEGKIHAEEINLIALGINNGWFDAALQEIGFINFSEYNSYYPLINETIYKEYLNASETLCVPPTLECQSINPNVELEQCFAAQNACGTVDNYYSQYYPNIDPYDIRQSGTGNIFPPETYVNYLRNPAIQKAIGALVEYQECPDAPGEGFFYTADGTRSLLPQLSQVIQSGIQVVIWAGDADSVCDWFGGFASVNSVEYSGQPAFKNKEVTNYTLHGTVKGTYKTVENLSWLRVFESGHEIPAFQPELSLQVFKQTMQRTPLHST